MYVYAIHKPNATHLAEVTTQMQALGVPSIRVVDCGDHYMALEGSHRLAAAAALGIQPDFEVFAQDEIIDITKFDWFDRANWAGETYPAGEVAGELFASTQAVAYSF